MKLNKLTILFIFTILIFIVTICNSEESAPGVPFISDPSPNLTTNPTPSPTPTNESTSPTPTETSTPTPTPTTTPTPTINPYADGKMTIKVNVGSIVNYNGNDCGEGSTPCKSIVDGFKKFINFKNVNSAISFSELEFIISSGVYNKSNFQEMANKLNLYDLGVNVSFVAAEKDVVIDGRDLDRYTPFAYISTVVGGPSNNNNNNNGPKKALFYFQGITFTKWNESTLLDISVISATPATENSLSTTTTAATTTTNETFINVLFKKCSFESILNNEIDLVSSKADKLGWVDISLEESQLSFTSAKNVFKLLNTKLSLRNGITVMDGRASEAFINGVGCSIVIENSNFRQYTTREGLLFTVNCSVSISNSMFNNNYGTFSSIIHYSSQQVDLNITKVVFVDNMVTNNGGKGDSIIIIKNEGPLNNQENNKHQKLPLQTMTNVNQERYRANIVNCTFQNNNTPKSIDSGLIWSYNAFVSISGTDIFLSVINDHGPRIISHQSTVDIYNCKFITSKPNTGFKSADQFPHIIANYSSVRTTNIIVSPPNELPFKCDSSLIEFDYRSGVNASLFICDNIHKEDYNSSYLNIADSSFINSFSCEIIQRVIETPSSSSSNNLNTPSSPIPFYPNIICSNESHHKYKYDFKLTKAIIAIIVIACTLLTLIPIVILANKIYKNLYRGYTPHESDEQDIEEFSINSGSTIDKGNNNNDGGSGFHDVSYDDETPNKSLLK